MYSIRLWNQVLVLVYIFYSFLSVLFICVFLTKNQVDKDELLDIRKLHTKNIKRVHQSQLFSGYNQKSISEIIVIVRIGRITWASLNVVLLIKARFLKKKSSPKRAVQTSPSITFYTHWMLNLIFSHRLVCCSCPFFKILGICTRKNLTATFL